jgi:hypothetical protein
MCAALRHQLDRSERSIHEVAQNLLILRCEATAEPRRRGGFAKVPLAGEIGEPQRAG